MTIITLCTLLYSPTIKLIQSIDFQAVSKEILQSLNIIPTIKYCDTLNPSHNMDECKECPKFARCVDGDVFCKGDKRFIRGECIYDPIEIKKLHSQMESYSVSLLASRCGEFECQSYALYNYLHRSSADDHELYTNSALDEEALSNELAKALQLDAQSHLFGQVFEKFTKMIKEDQKTIYFKDLEWAEGRGYFSNKSAKTYLCHLCMFFTDNALIIVPVTVWLVFGSLWYLKRQRVRNRVLRRR